MAAAFPSNAFTLLARFGEITPPYRQPFILLDAPMLSNGQAAKF
jgi:hypothetical protein